MSDDTLVKRESFSIRNLYSLLLKIIALFFIAFAIRYWLLAMGILNPTFGFDAMPTNWQTVVAILSVLQPIVAVGLWGGLRWGVVVWVIVVAIELVMHGLYPSVYGENDGLLLFHGFCFVSMIGSYFVRKFEIAREASRS